MSEAIQKTGSAIQKSTTDTLADLLRQRKDSIAQLVPKHLTPERLFRVAVNAVAKNPALQKCSPASLLQSVLVAAELGLEPGGALGHLYLVPYGATCTPIVGYRGLLELARRSGDVLSVRAVVVHAADRFRVSEGIEQEILHEPFLDGDPGELRFAYCVLKLKDGGVHVELMSRHQIDTIRTRSRAGGSGPWVTDYEEMAKKTVTRRALKWAPLSSERWDKALEIEAEEFAVAEEKPQEGPTATEKLKETVRKKRQIVDVPPEGIVPQTAEEMVSALSASVAAQGDIK